MKNLTQDWRTTVMGILAQVVTIFVFIEVLDDSTGDTIVEIAELVFAQFVAIQGFIRKDKKSPEDWKGFLSGVVVFATGVLILLGHDGPLIDRIEQLSSMIIGLIGLAIGIAMETPKFMTSNKATRIE